MSGLAGRPRLGWNREFGRPEGIQWSMSLCPLECWRS